MSLAVMMVFEILPALALGFAVGRFWQVRRDELDRRIFKGVARIRRLQSPTQWEVGVRSTLLRAEHASIWEIPHAGSPAGRTIGRLRSCCRPAGGRGSVCGVRIFVCGSDL